MDNKENKNREIAHRENNSFSFFDPFFNGMFRFPTFQNEVKEMEKLMKTDVHETEENFEIEIELPGFNKQDIDIELKNGYLTIEAKRDEKCDECDTKKKNYIRRERFYGSCARSFYVGELKREDISASLNDGVLYVTFPKEKNREKLEKIEIK